MKMAIESFLYVGDIFNLSNAPDRYLLSFLQVGLGSRHGCRMKRPAYTHTNGVLAPSTTTMSHCRRHRHLPSFPGPPERPPCQDTVKVAQAHTSTHSPHRQTYAHTWFYRARFKSGKLNSVGDLKTTFLGHNDLWEDCYNIISIAMMSDRTQKRTSKRCDI